MLPALLLWTAAATLLLEAITCLGRFGFGFRSREIALLYKRCTFGVRIHHGYVGAGAVPPTLLVGMDPGLQVALCAAAGGVGPVGPPAPLRGAPGPDGGIRLREVSR